jgi:hypothetical protein
MIHTEILEAGKYTAWIELLLDTAAPTLRNKNPSTSFSFEVAPLNTVRLLYLDNEAAALAPRIQDIFQKQGLLLLNTDGAYLALIGMELREWQNNGYYFVQPDIRITIEQSWDRKPLVTYTKSYAEFRHAGRDEALQRAYRNIESDLSANFTEQIRSIGR